MKEKLKVAKAKAKAARKRMEQRVMHITLTHWEGFYLERVLKGGPSKEEPEVEKNIIRKLRLAIEKGEG